jgi:hypothetical protein
MKFFFRIKEDSSEYINMISIGNVKIVTNKINVVATENAAVEPSLETPKVE